MIQQETFCKKEQHSNLIIRYLCLEPTCVNNRLLCPLCVRDSHRKHSIANLERYLDPLARLAMHHQHPTRYQILQELKKVSENIQNSFLKITQIVTNQFQKLQESLIYQIQIVSNTFQEEMLEEALKKMLSGKATSEEIEEYIKIINLLSNSDFDDPQKLVEVVRSVQKNMKSSIEQITKKIQTLMKQFQTRLNKNLLNDNKFQSIALQSDQNNQKSILLQSQPIAKKNKPVSVQPQEINLIHSSSKKKTKKQVISKQPKEFNQVKEMKEPKELKQSKKSKQIRETNQFPASIICDSAQKDSWSDQVKIQEDTISCMNQVKIGAQLQDGINQMKAEARAKVKRVVVGYCKNPQIQLTKILSLNNLQQLQINWYQLAKKEFLIKIINNLINMKSLVLNCANQFDQECCKMVPKKLTKIRKLQYGWDFLNSMRDYDEGIYYRLSPYTNRGCPLKTSVTREMVVCLKRIQNVWLGDFMYFRPSNNEIPFRNIKQFTLGQTKGKYFRIPEKLCVQLKDMRQLLSLAILQVRIDEKKLIPILANNTFIKTLLIEGCDDITDESLKVVAANCNLINLSIRESRYIEGAPIWNMKNLSTLVLVECSRINTQQAIQGLPKMKYLTYLNLYRNFWVTNQVVKHIPNAENFQSLNLGQTSITDESLLKIATMCNIKALCIDCNKLSGAAVSKLAHNIPQLQKISLWALDPQEEPDKINNDDIQILSRQLKSLNHLSIRYCKDLNPRIFLKFSCLRFLQIDRENLTTEVEQEFQKKGVKLICDIENANVEEVQ